MGGLISRRSGGSSAFYTWDPSGNVAQRLSAAGAVLSAYAVDAYGQRTGTDSSTADPYAGFGGAYGYYADAETGLSLLGHRYYDGGTGRFINRDPIGYAGGSDLYAFCGGNPVMLSDPTGFCAGGGAGNDDGILANPFNFADPRLAYRMSNQAWYNAGLDPSLIPSAVGVTCTAGLSYALNLRSAIGGISALTRLFNPVRAASNVGTLSMVPTIAQVVANGNRGRAFEAAALQAAGLTKNTATLVGQTTAGVAQTTIPDAVGAAITEIKDVQNLSYSAQLQAQNSIAVARGVPHNLIVGMNTQVSGPLERAIAATGGVIQRFDAATGTFHPYP